MGLTRLRWVTIGVPTAALAVLLYVVGFVLPDVLGTPAGFLVSVALTALAVSVFSRLVFAAIERSERQVLRQNARLSAAASVAAALSDPRGQQWMVRDVLDAVCDPLEVDAGLLCLTGRRTGTDASVSRGFPAVLRVRPDSRPEDAELIWDALAGETGPTVVEDAAADSDLRAIVDDLGFRSIIKVPLSANGVTEGSLALACREPGRFDPQDHRLVEQIARQVAVASQRANLVAEVMERNAELRLMNELSGALSRACELPEVLDLVLRTLLEASGGRRGELWLEQDGTLAPAYQVEAGAPAPPPGRAQDDGSPGWSGGRAPRTRGPSYEVRGGLAVASLPLRCGGHAFGVIRLDLDPGTELTGRLRRQLETLAEQSGPAVQNARLRMRAREVAVLEERGRISREMHDGLAQVLGYVNTKAFAVRRCLSQGDVATAESLLADLEEAARDVSADVREAVLALRCADPGRSGLLETISAYVDKFARLSGIAAECRTRGDVAAVRLPEMTELQVSRVIQEALSNVRKHAGVRRVVVTLTAANDCLEVRVDDEGRGFDARLAVLPGWPRFGLQTMRERAEAVGGRLSVSSQPGRGTHVRVRVPLRLPSVSPA